MIEDINCPICDTPTKVDTDKLSLVTNPKYSWMKEIHGFHCPHCKREVELDAALFPPQSRFMKAIQSNDPWNR